MSPAFIPTVLTMTSAPPSCSSPSPQTCSRRQALFTVVLSATAMLVRMPPSPALAGDERPGLPPGAAQLSRVVAAQRQWSSLAAVLTEDRVIGDEEWISLRAYLRNVYSVSRDMDYLCKGWQGEAKGRGVEVIQRFRETVKAMDKPADAKDVERFRAMHGEVQGWFQAFFEAQKAGVTGDVPDEL